MKYTSYKIKIRATINGVEKIPSKIAWIQGNDECLVTPCYKENDYLVVELLPDCVGDACIEGYLLFDDVCTDCEPIHFKRCFCSTDEDCEDCEECTAQGVCVSKCIGDEYCLDDKCVECDPNNPCPDGKICINGKCVCPQGTFESNGKCVECDSSTPLTKCQECRNGVIIEKVCDGVCDPGTGVCVDCLNSGDCYDRADGRNCCNAVTKKCECCPGTIWSAEQKKCIPLLCVSDADCGDPCLKCTPEGCQPMICPPGYKCWEGTCVYWPCTSTSCENGADCGPDCGCIELNGVRQCVPCHILNCLGLCQQALGCKCVNEVCVPVDNCEQYCDGFTPCTEPGCTCYNNRCVSCENFPCVNTEGGCASFYNCACNNENKCTGAGCVDKLEIKQECGSGELDCKLVAEFTTKGCKCDPIRFETINKTSCVPLLTQVDTLNPSLGLEVAIYKGQVLYSDFSNVNIGDNEIISGSIQTRVTHYNVFGEVISSINVAGIADKAISNNAVAGRIEVIKDLHFKRSYSALENGQQVTRGTLVKVELFAKNVEIPNNDCINYNDEVIATYELNFRTAQDTLNTCAALAQTFNTQKQVKQLNDTTSAKKPLFIWSKGITDFSTGPFVNNKVYNQSGWFRKVYGVKSGNVWRDTIDRHADPFELWNNYNYQVKVDCGCATVATKNKVLFCCAPEFSYALDNCNTKLTLQPFNVCDVNGKVSEFAPAESQTNYYLQLELKDGSKQDVKIEFDTTTRTVLFEYNEPTKPSIVKASIFQSYKVGGLLSIRECVKELDITEVAETLVSFVRTCNQTNPNTNTGIKATKVVVQQTVGIPKISKIEFLLNLNENPLNTALAFNSKLNDSGNLVNASSYTTYLPNDKIDFAQAHIIMRVFFDNGCNKDIRLQSCPTGIEYTPNPAISTLDCDNGIGAAITAVTSGFSNSLPITYYLEGESLTNPITNTTGVFSNLAEGFYILTAEQGDLIASVPVDVIGLSEPTVVLEPSTLCPGQTASIVISALPGTVFSASGPTGSLGSFTIDSTGTRTITGLSVPGSYIVALTNDVNNAYCPNFSELLTLTTGGQVLNPVIEVQGTVCVGEPLPFRISNGNGATFIISSNGSGTFGGSVITTGITSTLVASNTVYNGIFIPNTTNTSIRIVGVTDSCNTTSTPTLPINSSNLPVIVSATPSCDQLTASNTVTVVTTGATGVNIGGVEATLTTPGVYVRTNITGLSSVTVIVRNASCDVTQTVTLSDCNCPSPGTINISSTGDTCGPGSTTIQFTGSNLPISGTIWQWKFQQMSGGNYVDLGGYAPFAPIILSPTPTVNVPTSIGEIKSVRLRVLDTTNGCEYDSDPVSFTAVSQPTGLTITPSPGTIIPSPVGASVQFRVNPGFNSYQWSGDVTGNTFESVPVIFTTAGNKVATVTVSSASGCSSVISYPFSVVEVCNSPMSIQQPTSAPCEDIQVIVTGGVGNRFYQVFGNIITVPQTAIPGNGVITIPTSGLLGGEVDNITIQVWSDNGCFAEREYEYTRCNCICSELGCTSAFSQQRTGGNATINDTLGSFVAGTVLNWGFSPSVQADKMVIKENGVTILDTGAVSAYSSCACASINVPTVCSCPGVLFLGDEVGNTAVALTVGTGDVSSSTFSVCPTDALEVQYVIEESINGLLAEIGGQLTLSGTGPVTVTITPNSCGGVNTSWNYKITCL